MGARLNCLNKAYNNLLGKKNAAVDQEIFVVSERAARLQNKN